MPRLNSLGSALMGTGSGINSIDGAVPPSLASASGAGGDWLTDDKIITPTNLGLGAGLNLYQVVVSTDTLSLAAASGANYIVAGGGVWTRQLGGVQTNVVAVPSLPNSGTGDVDFDGTWCVVTTYASGSGITVYAAIGTVLQQINVSLLYGAMRMRDGWLTYPTAHGWPVVDSQTGSPCPGYVQQQSVGLVIPVGDTMPVLVEWKQDTSQFSIRRADQGTGLLLPVNATMFNVDAVRLSSGIIRLAWSTGAGELPAELVVMDVDTSTGDTEVGTVVGSTLVFATGPTLEGSRFRLVQAPVVYPPYKDEMNVTQTIGGQRKKTISQPWVRYLDSTSQGVTSLQTAINSLPPPIPPSTFDAQVVVSEAAAGFPLARVLADSATVEWDTSVPNAVSADAVGVAVECYIPMTTGAIPGEVLFVGPDVMLMKVPVT